MLKNLAIALGMAPLLIGGLAGAGTTADTVVEAARAECASFDSGVLTTGVDAVSRVDVSGDGQPDEIIDAHGFSCSSAASLYCGTGGCSLTVIVDGQATAFLAKAWKMVTWGDEPILLLAVHGSECGGTNARRCIKAYVWEAGSFHSVAGSPAQ